MVTLVEMVVRCGIEAADRGTAIAVPGPFMSPRDKVNSKKG